MTIVFATNNQHKLQEIRNLASNRIKILSLREINCKENIPETGKTLEANALQKAQFVHNKYEMNCFADDTGLEIDALSGKPGVYSARYAGKEQDFEKNMNKVLYELKNIDNRQARFRTVIALILKNKTHYFKGIINGKITREKKGLSGFGYDPIFMPDGYDKTFAEMKLEQKNQISHRAIATRKLISFLFKQ